ncbi:MAG: BatA domain-containing protein [Planctomycetota bacterium]
MPLSPIVAFGFANLAALGWLAAAAAPILIHLWMRQTHRETAWAAMRFLRAALERQARRLRLQHWVLLAVRTALLVLVMLAAAKPLLDNSPIPLGAPRHRVTVIDASLSMSATDGGGRTALERAKAIAAATLDAARAGDTHSLVVLGAVAPPAAPVATPDADAVRRAIDAVAPGAGVATATEALAEIESRLAASPEPGRTPEEVVLLTDFGLSGWSELADTAAAEPWAELADRVKVVAYDVGAAAFTSVLPTGVALDDDLPTTAAAVDVLGEVRRYGATAEGADQVMVELVVDGAPVAEQRVKLAATGATPVAFSHRFAAPGLAAVGLRVASPPGADAIGADNTRWLVADVRARRRVLCVEGSRDAAAYLADALDPAGDGQSAFEPVVVSDADLAGVDFTEFDAVLLSNVADLANDAAQRLTRYATAGGGVWLCLGDRVDADRYNALFAPSAGSPLAEPLGVLTPAKVSPAANATIDGLSDDAEPPPALLPGLLGPSEAIESFRVDPLGYAHPIAAPFRGYEESGLLTIPVARRLPLRLAGGVAASLGGGPQIVASLADGSPLLATTEVGRGRAAVLTTAATLAVTDPATGQPWTALPAWPSFLPLVRSTVRYLATADGADALLVGEPLVGSDAAGTISIRPPRLGDLTPSAQSVTPSADGRWRFRAAGTPGVWRYGAEGGTPTAARAINTDPAESAPTRVSRDRLPGWLTVRSGDGPASAAIDGRSVPIHRWLLYGALALALIEPVLACRFGRGSA